MNTSTNIFYWDNQYAADMLMTLEPETMMRQFLLWTSTVDEDSGVPSSWAYWGYDYSARRGVGNYYSANDMTLFELMHSYLRISGDSSFLATEYLVGPWPNGTYTNTTVYDTAVALATHWKSNPAYNVSMYLADYGGAPNLLECVPTYIHRVASINAGNSYMSLALADIAEWWAGDASLAAALRADADAIAGAVLGQLYIPGSGYFGAGYPNGTVEPVLHVMDYTYVTEYLRVNRSGQVRGYIPESIAAEMSGFVHEQLR